MTAAESAPPPPAAASTAATVGAEPVQRLAHEGLGVLAPVGDEPRQVEQQRTGGGGGLGVDGAPWHRQGAARPARAATSAPASGPVTGQPSSTLASLRSALAALASAGMAAGTPSNRWVRRFSLCLMRSQFAITAAGVVAVTSPNTCG